MNFIFGLSSFESKIAIINEFGDFFYYGELMEFSAKLGLFLGCQPKKLVIILAKNNIETLIGYLAALQSNHAVILIDANLNEELTNNLVDIYHPNLMWKPKKNDSLHIFEYGSYELIEYQWQDNVNIYPALSLLLSTSGTTGSPKLVRLTKDNLIANARSIGTYLNLNETEKPITNLPIHYSYGLSVINSHLIVGATILLTDMPVVKKEFWDFFTANLGTSLTGVPYTYEILKRIGFNKMDLPSLRYMTQAGGKLNAELVLEYAELSREKKFDFYVMYGTTEATARIAYLEPEYNRLKVGSIGKAIPDGKMWLVDVSGNPIIKPNIEGELVYQGPNVMLGYGYCREDLSKRDELFGVLKTGDLAYFDKDGFYYITGRKNRFLKILGKRFSLSEIENHLQSMGHHCFCGGEDDLLRIAYHQEEILSIPKATFNDIRKEVFIRFKIPLDLIQVFLIKNIPRTNTGKVNYSELFLKKSEQPGDNGGRNLES